MNEAKVKSILEAAHAKAAEERMAATIEEVEPIEDENEVANIVDTEDEQNPAPLGNDGIAPKPPSIYS